MTESEKLMPCPFCGGEPLYGANFGIATICCENTDCAVMPSVDSHSRETATEAWNTRTTNPTPAPDDVVIKRGDALLLASYFGNSDLVANKDPITRYFFKILEHAMEKK
jgi:Restriction alleviation protein Lar